MPKVNFEGYKECEAQNEQSVLDTALIHEVPLMHACGGHCGCGTCQVVLEASDFESMKEVCPISEVEEKLLSRSKHRQPTSRLACQLKASQDLSLKIPIPAPQR